MAGNTDDYWTPERIEQDKKNHSYKQFRIYFTNGDYLFWCNCEVRFPLESDRVVIYSRERETFVFMLNNIAGYGFDKGE